MTRVIPSPTEIFVFSTYGANHSDANIAGTFGTRPIRDAVLHDSRHVARLVNAEVSSGIRPIGVTEN